MRERELRRVLESVPIPDEDAARDRAWRVVSEAFVEREHVAWPRRHTRALVAALGAAALVAAALSPPGLAVLGSLRDAVGRERVTNAKPGLESLPTAGRLLVSAPDGTWVVFRNGSRRNLGPYSEAWWSPSGVYVVGTVGNQLKTFEPSREGHVHWALSRPQRLSHPRWAPDGYRIAYLAGPQLRVVVGDGSVDSFIALAAPVAPAWRPLPIREPVGSRHVLAYVDRTGRVTVADTDTRARLWRLSPVPDRTRELEWSDDGRLLVVRGHTSIRVYSPAGRLVSDFPTKGPSVAVAFRPRSQRLAFAIGGMVVVGDAGALRRTAHPVFRGAGLMSDLAWSPDGRWLLAAWRSKDQWLFIRSSLVSRILDVAGQFAASSRSSGAFPIIDGWCCSG